ncbi:MAG: extracellular solute-binding protein [Candidatus Hydrogenedentota bacterium]
MKKWGILFLFALTACSSPDESADSERSVIVVYSPHGPDVGKDYERLFEEAHPDIDLQWIDNGSQDVYNRISSEKSRPACDVWWGAPSTMFMKAADEGLLAEYTPTWANSIDEGFKDPDSRWYGTYSTPLAIMFNNRKYTRETVPQTWDELLTPKWNQKITIRNPLPSGTMRTFIGATILRAGSDDAGIEWLRKLHAATKTYMQSPQLLFDHMKRNEDLITVWIMPDAVLQRERNGFPFDFHLPKQAPVLTEGIAVIEGAPHRANAELFYEFVTTQEALAYQANEYAKVPTRNDLDTSLLPDWMNEQKVDAMKIDWKVFAEKEQLWCDRWKTEVYDAK